MRLHDGTFGACQVLRGLGQERFGRQVLDVYAVGVFDWRAAIEPTVEDLRGARPLLLRAAARSEREVVPAVFRILGTPLPKGFVRVGNGSPIEWPPAELPPFGRPWEVVTHVAYFEPLFLHDRDAYERELVERRAETQAAVAEASRQRLRRGRNTKVDPEALLHHLEEDAPPALIARFRDAVRSAKRELDALGRKVPKAKVREVLRRSIEECNVADESSGGILNTEGAEELVSAFIELGAEAGVKISNDEIDEWRRF